MKIQISDEHTIAQFRAFSHILFARMHIFFKQIRSKAEKAAQVGTHAAYSHFEEEYAQKPSSRDFWSLFFSPAFSAASMLA